MGNLLPGFLLSGPVSRGMRSVPPRGTRVRVTGGPFAGEAGTADGYAHMAGVRHVRVRLYNSGGVWVQTIYIPSADLERVR